jgi:cellulose biosynthesis protein BcsQ
MNAKVAAIASMKGGVGKTTMTLSLAEGSAAVRNKRVLVVDLDPQINASTLLTGGMPKSSVPWKTSMTLRNYLEKRLKNQRVEVDEFVLRDVIDFSPARAVSLISGSYDLRAFERHLLVRSGQSIESAMNCMRDAIDAIIEEQAPLFDLIVFDCPPGFSLLTEAALSRSDMIVLPTAPNNLGTQGLLAFAKYLNEELEIENAVQKTFVFLTMTRGTSTSRDFEKAVRAEEKQLEPRYRIMKSSFPYLDGFQRAMDRRESRMRVLSAIRRTLNRLRNRTLFERLYEGVDGHVAKVVNELWDHFKEEEVSDERVATRQGARRNHYPEARA